ncbi:MAG: slipin family protein [Thermosynechococcaceae cyanobacterium]
MFGFIKQESVKPNQVGYIYKNNRFHKKLKPGLYRFFSLFDEYMLVSIPIGERFGSIVNQEVLTKDNIALRFSYFTRYFISDPDCFISKFDVFNQFGNIFFEPDQLVHHLSQIYIRQEISQIESESLSENRNEILSEVPPELFQSLNAYGISLLELRVKDITFPKTIQDLFARRLEAKIRAYSDLENARTAVATARTLKNAAELMKGNENIKYLQLLEVLTKIASTGKHTFVFGDLDSKKSELLQK